MPLIDTKQIPGYVEAVEAQDLIRDAAFLGLSENICGIEVSPMTFRHLIWLQMIRSPFVGAGQFTQPHLQMTAFLKTIAPMEKPAFMVDGGEPLKKFMGKVGELTDMAKVLNSIREYVSETFMDSPGGGGGSGDSFFSVGAAAIHRLCSKYGGLNPNPTIYPSAIDMPLKAAFQFLKCIRRDDDPKAILFNGLSDRVKSVWINSQNKPEGN